MLLFVLGMRRPYHDESSLFKETDLVSKEPFANFGHWFELACENKSLIEPNAMSLSTCSKYVTNGSLCVCVCVCVCV